MSASKRLTWNCGSHMPGSSSSHGIGQRSRPSSFAEHLVTGSQPSESLRHEKTMSLGSLWWNISKLRATPPQPESTSRFLGALRRRKS